MNKRALEERYLERLIEDLYEYQEKERQVLAGV